MIPPFTTVFVQCRFYSPIMTSLEPDGYRYLIIDEPVGQHLGAGELIHER